MPARSGGSTGNSRLTALSAVVLLVLLALEGATLLSLRTFLSWHIAIGILLVPLVGLKLGSVAYRFARYYMHRAEYVAAGPPPTLLRMLGPIVVLATVGLFASGVALAVLGPGTSLVLPLHKASFIIWVVAMAIHVPAHVLKLPALATADLRRDGAGGAGLRAGIVGVALVSGAILAIASLPLVSPWVHWMRDAHG